MTTTLHIARFVATDVIGRGEATGRAVRVVQRSGFAALVGGCTTT